MPKEKPNAIDLALKEIHPRPLPDARLDKPAASGGKEIIYRPHFNEMAYNMRLLGYTDKEMAKVFGVSEQTIYDWKKKYPKFKQAVIDAGPVADSAVAKAMLSRATGYEHDVVRKVVNRDGSITEVNETIKFAPDVNAGFKWLSARQRKHWSERTEITGKDGGPIDVVHSVVHPDPLEAAKIYQAMITGSNDT